jgi:hypothetical protein
MKTRIFVILTVCTLGLAAVVLLLSASANLARLTANPARAASDLSDAPVPVWTSEGVVAYRTPGGLKARSLVTMPGGRWYFSLGGDRVVLASETDPALYVDEDVLQAQNVQVALYSDDRAALVYLDTRPEGTRLNVARPTASGYRRETVQSVSDTQIINDPSLVVDSRGWLHLTYFVDGDLLYMFRDETTWHSPEVLASPGGAASGLSLAVDATDKLHLVYVEPGYPDQLFALSRTNSTWSAPTFLWNGNSPLLLVDNLDRLQLISGGTDPGLVYGVLEPGGWVTETVDTADVATGFDSALALDDQGNPHISYIADVCGGCYDLRVAYREGSTWHKETLWGGPIAPSTALSVDGSGDRYLMYILGQALHTAMDTGGGWVFDDPAFPYSRAILGNSVGLQPALAAWQPSQFQAIFRSVLTGTDRLNYAQAILGDPWLPVTLSETLAIKPQIAVDISGNTHVVYAHDQALVYQHKPIAGSWSEVTFAADSATPNALSLAVDGQGKVGVAYRVPGSLSNSTLKFIRQEVSSWSTPLTLDSGRCAAPALAFDSSDKAHVITACGQEIIHHFEGSSGWDFESYSNYNIDSIATLVLVLDADGLPVIGLDGFFAEAPVVQSVWKDSTGWHWQSLGSGTLSESTPLQLDSSGVPTLLVDTIVPVVPPMQGFDVRKLTGGSWSSADFIWAFPEAGEVAFDLDPTDEPYLLYYDSYRDDLYLANKTLMEAPGGLSLSGPTSGYAGQVYTFTAETSPAGTDLPLVYNWNTTDFLHLIYTGTLTSQAAYSWETPGTKVITTTVSNAAGEYWALHTIQIEPLPSAIAPQSLGLDHLAYAAAGTPAEFTAQVEPPTTTVPLDYVWTSAELAPIQNTRGLSDTVAFTWDAPGAKTVAVSASNAAGSVSETTSLLVEIPISGLSMIVEQGSRPGLRTSFTALISAGSDPACSWDFGDGESASGAAVEHSYAQPGTYTVTLTAANHVSQVVVTVQLPAYREIYLPLLDGSAAGSGYLW